MCKPADCSNESQMTMTDPTHNKSFQRLRALKMQSARGIESLQLVTIDDPGRPGPGEIRVKVAATSLNGHDVNVVLGRLPTEVGRILMTDGAGTVEQVGDGVTDFAVGDRVLSTFFPDWQDGPALLAGFSRTPGDGIDGHGVEVVVRPAASYTKMPDGWSFTEAATLPTAGLTAWRALFDEGHAKAGTKVLILGTGAVSILALQFAHARGARVVITSSSSDKLKQAADLGAEWTVNYRANSNWGAEVRELTGGVDLVIETAGPGTLAQSIDATRIGGHIVLVGVLTGIAGIVPTATIMGKQLTLTGITVGSKAHQASMVEALNAMSLRPYIGAVFPFNRIQEAFRLQSSEQHFGKIAIEV